MALARGALVVALLVEWSARVGGQYGAECSLCPIPDYFSAIDLTVEADFDTIKKQCRQLRFKWHPDKNQGNEEEAKKSYERVDEACKVLTKKPRAHVGVDASYDDRLVDAPEDDYNEYLAKFKICQQCAELESQGSGFGFWPFDAYTNAAEEARQSSSGGFARGGDGEDLHRYEDFEENGRKFRREIRCDSPESYYGTGLQQCVARDYMQVPDMYGRPAWYPVDSHWYTYDPERQAPQYDPYMHQGEFLRVGAYITAEDGSHFAIMLADGNFAIFAGAGPHDITDNPSPIWETRTHTMAHASYCLLQDDGNLGVFAGPEPALMSSVLWHSNKRGEPMVGDRFYGKLENDGNFVVYSERYNEIECLWASIGCPDSSDVGSSFRRLRNNFRLSAKRAFGGGTNSAARHRQRTGGIGNWLKAGVKSIWEFLTQSSERKHGDGGGRQKQKQKRRSQQGRKTADI